MYSWVLLWFILGGATCIGVLYLVYVELFPEAEEKKEEAD